MTGKDLSAARKEYGLRELRETDLAGDPFVQFANWFEEAASSGLDEPNAMALSTSDAHGRPSSRMVLLKCFDDKGFVFYSNYLSRKGRELAENPHASLLFFWKEMERQIRIEGGTVMIDERESDEYFYGRPPESRAAAAVSAQSTVIPTRDALEYEYSKLLINQGLQKIKRPPDWGGYRVTPEVFEFWQGRENRLHDRLRYRLDKGLWVIERLAP